MVTQRSGEHKPEPFTDAELREIDALPEVLTEATLHRLTAELRHLRAEVRGLRAERDDQGGAMAHFSACGICNANDDGVCDEGDELGVAVIKTAVYGWGQSS